MICDEYFSGLRLMAKISTIIIKETVTAGVEYKGLKDMPDIVGTVILNTFKVM